jgi:hypothetical protein
MAGAIAGPAPGNPKIRTDGIIRRDIRLAAAAGCSSDGSGQWCCRLESRIANDE